MLVSGGKVTLMALDETIWQPYMDETAVSSY